MKKIIKYISAHKVISGVVVVVLIVAGYYTYTLFRGTTVPMQYVLGKVQQGDLVVAVSGTGQVATLSKVEIKPQTTGQTQTLGQIIKVNVTNGQSIKAGDVIAVIDGKTALQSVNQAKASVASAQASYDKLVNGATDSDLQSNRSSVQSAQTSLQNSLQNISTKLQSDYIAVSNAVYLSTDPFFSNPFSNPSIILPDVSFLNQQLQFNVNNGRTQVGEILKSLKDISYNISSSSDPVAVSNDAISKFTTIRNYFDDMTMLLTSYSTSASSAGQSAINSDKSTASSARSSANSAVADIISALQSYQSAVISLDQAKTSLSFKQAPPNRDDVVVAQSQLDNAKSNLANAYETYSSRIIIAPFDGQIGGLTAQVGQQVSSSDVLGTIITPQKVVNVSLNEVDAAKVKSGDEVSLTFDALPSVVAKGKISFVDPLGTVSQGVVNYSVQIVMYDQNDQIKTGMTATASIVTGKEQGVLMVPSSAITKIGNRSIVMVPNTFATSTTTPNTSATSTATSTRFRSIQISGTSNVHAVPVTVGISNDTMTEILSGLNVDDTIVVRTISGTASANTAGTARTGSLFGLGGMGGGGGGGARTGGGASTGR